MKTTLYLIQTAAGLPAIYACLKDKNYLLLSYKENTTETTIFAAGTTWTQGRNLLYKYVRDNNLQYDYYVFMDEDVVFHKPYKYALLNQVHSDIIGKMEMGRRTKITPLITQRQAAGFKCLESVFIERYPIVVMRFGFWRDWQRSLCWNLQSVYDFDACLSAFSNEVFFADTILPYIEDYDADSWWISQYILNKKAEYYYPKQVIQNNQVTIINSQASAYPRGNNDLHALHNNYAKAVKNESIRDGKDYLRCHNPADYITEITPTQPLPPIEEFYTHERWRDKIHYYYHYLFAFAMYAFPASKRYLNRWTRHLAAKLFA